MYHVRNVGSFDACGCDLDSDATRPERLGLEAVPRQFVRNFGEDCLLCGREFKDERHKQTLAFDLLRRALLQNSFEEHALMGHVLVYDPEPLMIHCQDERLANLPERLQ